jgi:hypothetical protein
MAKWELYCARGITDEQGKFNPKQIEEGLKVGLNPQPIFIDYDPQLIAFFVDYVRRKRNSGLNLKLTAHPRSLLLDESAVKRDLDILVNINQTYGEPIIKEAIFDVGQVVDPLDELAFRGFHETEKGDCPFTPEEFLAKLKKARKTYQELREFGRDRGINVLVENDLAIEYEQWLGAPHNKPEELKKDVRWADGPFLPGLIQAGLLGSSYDLAYIVGTEGLVCIDIGHLNHTREYFDLVDDDRRDSSPPIHPDIPLSFKKGKPILLSDVYDEFDPIAFIQGFKGRIPVCNLGGQVQALYDDEGIVKIGSHMPITFPGDGNSAENSQDYARKAWLTESLTALHAAGCRKGVFKIHLGKIYTGEVWQEKMRISKRNVESILGKVD